jgi:hypothetical protein
MKLVMQIALGVFLGSLPALFIVESWWNYQQEQLRAETAKLMEQQEQVNFEQGERIRAIINQNRQSNPGLINPVPGLSPEEGGVETLKPN